MCVRDLRQVGVFFSSYFGYLYHDIAEILLKVMLSTISLAYLYLQSRLIYVQYIKYRTELFPSELKT